MNNNKYTDKQRLTSLGAVMFYTDFQPSDSISLNLTGAHPVIGMATFTIANTVL